MKKNIRCISLLLGTVLIILDGDTASRGISQGIEMCLQAVIPSLFPFIILCSLLTGELTGQEHRLGKWVGRIFLVEPQTVPLLITGLIGGYPSGARSVDQAYAAGRSSKKQAEHLLPICNQCGPAFLFGMVRGAFDDPWSCWILWAIQLICVFSIAQLSSLDTPNVLRPPKKANYTLMTAMRAGIRTMSEICGWIICFRMLILFLERWVLWPLSPIWRTAIIGALELSNGCLGLRSVTDPDLRFILCSGMLSFGGLCVTMQTLSVTSPSLDKRPYIRGKLTQCVLSMLLATSFCLLKKGMLTALIPISPVIAFIIVNFILKKGRFSRRIHV